MAPEVLAQVLRPLSTLFNAADYPDLLVGLGKADDAAVYRLNDRQSIVATTDFFTPVVDDPFAYGAIAAANSLSDLYAMGATPLFALNIAAFPPQLPADFIGEILKGGALKVKEANAAIAGGHTISDKEPKYGLAAIGIVDTDYVLRKAGAKPGDKLFLTKPLGTGVLTTAFMRDRINEGDLKEATESMMQLNREAADVAKSLELKAVTDITGFGLLGHASEMLTDDIAFRFFFNDLPVLDGAKDFGEDWVYPGGAHNNRSFYGKLLDRGSLDEWQELFCFSPETSGGLLIAVGPEKVNEFTSRLPSARCVGEVIAAESVSARIVLS